MGSVLRVLLLVNTDKPAAEIVHVYLKEAQRLRPDQSGAWRRIEYTIGKRLVTETPREGRTEPE